MIRTIFVLGVVILLSVVGYAQTLSWQDISGPSPSFVLRKGADGKLFAGGNGGGTGNGKVFASTDNGLSWSPTTISNGQIIELVTNNQMAVASRTINSGIRYLVSMSTDNGTTWNQIYSYTFNFPPFYTYIYLMISDSGKVFSVGPTSQTGWGLARYTGLGRWTPSGPALFTYSADVPTVSSVDHSNNFYVGSSKNGLFVSSNEGAAWRQTLQPRSISSLMTDIPQKLVAGTNPTQTTSGGVFLSSDGGINWSLLGLTGMQINSLTHDTVNNMYASTEQGLYKYGGSPGNWESVGPISDNLDASLAIDTNTILTTSTTAGMYLSNDRGAHWSQTAIIQQDVSSLLATPSGTLYAGTLGNRLFRSTDLGKSWLQTATGSMCDYINSFSQSGASVYAGTDCGVYQTVDGGDHWSNVSQGSISGGIFSLAAVNSGVVYAGTNFGVYASTDTGRSWRQSGLAGSKIISLAVSPLNDLLAATPTNGLFLSSDNGVSWNPLSLLRDDIQAVNIDNSGNMFAAVAGGVFASSDRGLSWNYNNFVNGYVYSLAVTGASTVLAGAADGMYISTNSGQTWARKNPGTAFPVVLSMYADQGGNIFAGIYQGGVYKSTQPLTSVESPVTLPQSMRLFQNYPNPFNPATQLQFANSKLQLVTLKIYDVLGREVVTLVDGTKSPGEYTVSWNASNMPSGVYFYKLHAGAFTNVKKMLLLR